MTSQIIDQYFPDVLLNISHIYIKNNENYSCVLNMSDVSTNCNKFYILQLIERNDKKAYFIFTRSGRVGYKGTETIDCFIYETDAVTAFKNIFKEKTSLDYDDKNNKDLKYIDKYQYIEMADSNPTTTNTSTITDINNTVPVPVLEKKINMLIDILFDAKIYEQAMEKFDLNIKRTPLGSISISQISKAFKTLKKIALVLELESELSNKSNNFNNEIAYILYELKLLSPELNINNIDINNIDIKSILTDLTSEFYSIIPSGIGMAKAVIISTIEMITEKSDLLKILEHLSVFKNLPVSSVNYDKYSSLNCNIQIANYDESQMILKYFFNTAGSTHKIGFSIKEIYSVNRIEENLRFEKWKNLHNRQLLWHGSKLCNFVSILKNGLILNPGNNVKKTGSMFGHGLYFSNCSTKSGNYTGYNKGNPCIMILCEVALGTVLKYNTATNVTELKLPYNSVQGVGMSSPNPLDDYITEDGLIIPLGKLIQTTNVGKSLLYDEFIVYDQSQVRIKYIILLN